MNTTKTHRWADVRAARTDITDEQRAAARAKLDAEVAAYRLAEIRKEQHRTQTEVAATMGVGQRRVSDIEHGEVNRTEVGTLAAYIDALGGKLKLVADFGDDRTITVR